MKKLNRKKVKKQIILESKKKCDIKITGFYSAPKGTNIFTQSSK